MGNRRIGLALAGAVFLLLGLWAYGIVMGGWAYPPTAPGPAFAMPRAAAGATTTYTTYLPLVLNTPPSVPRVIARIKLPTGSHPHGIALDIEGERAFVGNHHANTLAVLDTAAMTVTSIIPLPEADGPNGVAYNPITGWVYVANRNTDNLSVVSPTVGTIVDTISVGQWPDGVVVQDDLIYVANFGSDSVSVLDAQTNAVIRTLDVGDEPALMAKSEETNTVYLASHGNHVVYYLQDGYQFNSRPGVEAPYGLGFDPVSYRLFVANRGSKRTVTLVDVNPNHWMGTIDVGREPFVVGVNPSTGHIFVVCGDRVGVYDRRDNGWIATVPVGGGAEEGVAVDPVRNLVYVTSSDADEVAVIQDVPTTDIAYVSSYSELWISNDAGDHARSLVTGSGVRAPSWRPQPDGQPPGGWRLLFAAYDLGPYEGWDIWWVEAGGQNLVNLTRPSLDPAPGEYEDVEPAWSPDGSQIAWRRDWSIWVMDHAGYGKSELTPGFGARTPRWSPDGQWIAFVGSNDPGREEDLFIVSPDGAQLHNVTDDPDYQVLEATWSPDGRELVYETDRDGNWEIYRANIENPASPVVTRLTYDPAADRFPVWSPDGARVAFISDREGTEYIYLMDTDGTDQRPLSALQPVQMPLAWSPDGRRLAFQVGLSDDAELYTLDVETGEVVRLTDDATADGQPTWRPDPW